MFTIISATNRKGSNTLKVAEAYMQFFIEEGIEAKLLSLEELHSLHRDEVFNRIEAEYLIPAKKFIFIMPEYNGSFPGIFKLMMDISDLASCWNFKKVLMVGVANGRAGNLRGIDMMTNMCHYMKMDVFYNKLPISSISKELHQGKFIHEQTIASIKHQIKGFIQF
jgi:chromate reductase